MSKKLESASHLTDKYECIGEMMDWCDGRNYAERTDSMEKIALDMLKYICDTCVCFDAPICELGCSQHKSFEDRLYALGIEVPDENHEG